MLPQLESLGANLAVLSIVAFAIAIVVSCFSRVNVGILSIALAFLVGVALGGMSAGELIAGFPGSLFLTLLGVTLFFSQARVNGTLDAVTKHSVRLARGSAGSIPLIFFLLAALLSTIGAGNIATTALLAPVAMAVAGRIGVSGFLMAILVCSGANAGTFSPLAPPGVVANGLLERMGIAGQQWPTYYNNFLAQSFIGIGGYFLLGGYRLFGRSGSAAAFEEISIEKGEPLFWNQKLTLALIAVLVFAVSFWKVDVGMAAFVAATVLTLARAADEESAVKAIPWNVIVMVCGVTVLISILDRKGGMDLFTTILAKFATERSVTGVMAFVTGLISVYSSSSGVVMPAFLPTVPSLIEKVGGGDPIALASAINVGTFLVDVSPLSTLGALCIANAAPSEDRRSLFNKMLAWGLSMSVVGGIFCWIFFGLL